MNFQGRRFRNGEQVYSEWFQRGGDNAIFRAEKINADVPSSGGITVKFEFYSKNSDDQSDGTVIEKDGGAGNYELSISDTDSAIKQLVIKSTTDTPTPLEGFQELVRIRASVTAGGDDNWLLGRMFPPVWFDEAN
ncbi:MAG: hypothetical protein ACYS5W_21320 [Planctomycetota bacterium]|jgi:hypothetical protein